MKFRKEIISILSDGRAFNAFTGKIHPSLRAAKISRTIRAKRDNCQIQFCIES